MRLKSIRAAAHMGVLSGRNIRRLIRAGKCPGEQRENGFYVDVDALLDALEKNTDNIKALLVEDKVGCAPNILCGECDTNIGLCPWLKDGLPVDGWEAEPSVIHRTDKDVCSYHITGCPLFVPNPRSKLYGKEGKRG